MPTIYLPVSLPFPAAEGPRRDQASQYADQPGSQHVFCHCASRCVRRAFLCGEDRLTGRFFERRRGWIEDRLLELAGVFAIAVCAFAVMPSHTHVVQKVDEVLAASWSERDVIERWHALFQCTAQSQSDLAGVFLSEVEQDLLEEQGVLWRDRLTSISWFVGRLNEHIARKANEEDRCAGRFWEGRSRRACRQFWSGLKLAQMPGCAWPRNSRPVSAPG